MSDIVLSAGVRQNLLSLQNTANLLSITQNRLATGKKVNSALDNPVNFFTSAGLQSRAGDLSSLVDAMSNGVKTLQAADNGLTAITNTIQSMQSTLLQARQDKSYKTQAYSLGTINAGSMQYLRFSGGSVGTTPVQVALETNTGGSATTPTAATTTGGPFTAMDFTAVPATAGKITGGAFAAMNFTNVAATPATLVGSDTTNGSAGTFANINLTNNADNTFSFKVNGGSNTITLTQADSGGDNIITLAEAQAAIQTQLNALNAGAGIGVSVAVGSGANAGKLVFSTTATGSGASVAISNIATGGTGNLAATTALGFQNGDTASGVDAVTPTMTFNVAVDGGATASVTINQAAVAAAGNFDTTIDSAAELQSIIDNQLGSNVTVGSGAGVVTLTSNTLGAGSSVAISGLTVSGVANTSGLSNITQSGTAAVTPTLTFNIAIDGGTASSVTIDQAAVAAVGDNDNTIDNATELATIIGNQLGSNITVDTFTGQIRFTSNTPGGGSAIAITAVTATDVINTSGVANVSVAGTASVITGGTNIVKTADQIVNDINNDPALKNKISASNDGGQIRIQNLATGDLTVAGLDVSGNISGGVGTSTIAGNQVRKNLSIQFNQLRDQLNKLANDSSFNGVNLLAGDKLKVIFNETGTSTLDIQAKDPAGTPFTFNAANLGISALLASDLDLDTSIDGFLGTLSQALNTTRSQASNFGSSLSIVQNRQDFTKAMINTLQTGADNLVLADTNEEGANLLALQTRQQLSTTALSLANQASQAVLRLFG